ncbi:MAG: hypothetical protein JST85_29730 [Acidobacteria bacterium]|nr:hypothetical protein [Acidobacteriota bacterium]
MKKLNSVDRRKVLTERGAGRLLVIFLLALASAIVYVVVIYVPIYQSNEAMQMATVEILHRGALQNLKEDDIRAQLKEKARECGLPEDHRLELWRDGRGYTAKISYKHHVSFLIYNYDWPFQIAVKDPGI